MEEFGLEYLKKLVQLEKYYERKSNCGYDDDNKQKVYSHLSALMVVEQEAVMSDLEGEGHSLCDLKDKINKWGGNV